MKNEIAEIMGAIGVPNMTDDEWAEHDRQVRAELAAFAAAQAAEERRFRQRCILAGGASERSVDEATGPTFDPNTPAVLALADFGADPAGGDGGGDPFGRIRVLSGPVGTGKTVAAVRWLIDHGGRLPAFMRATAFEVHGRYDKDHRAWWQEATALALDDLGVEYADGKGNLLSDLDTLVDHYHGRRAKLVITTNLTVEQFRERYGERIYSRLRQSGGWCEIGGADRRGRK